MKHSTRKRLSLLILLVGLPLYIIVATIVVGLFERPHILVELAVYVGLGILWALPFRSIFLGVARDDPGAGGDQDGGAR